jgi:preprotein translocase subunit SecB
MAVPARRGSLTMNTQPDATAPSLNVLIQYLKDFSFENPRAPQSLGPLNQPPAINIQINVNARPLGESDIEVDLKVEGTAETADKQTLFAFELTYGGVFRMQNIPANDRHPVALIECPRLLFPFAREIIATATRNGGFPPLMIDPVDFVALYRQRAAQEQAAPPAVN